MAFPTSRGTRNRLDRAMDQIDSLMVNIKNHAVELRAASAAGPVVARRVVNMIDSYAQINTQLNALKTVPGLAAYVKAQYDDAALDIVAEFNAVQTALEATIVLINNTIPKAAGRWLSIEELVNGVRTDRMLDSAAPAMVDLRTQLDALIAAID